MRQLEISDADRPHRALALEATAVLITTTVDGASTIEVEIPDPTRAHLIGVPGTGLRAAFQGRPWTQVTVDRRGTDLVLGFEDALVARLRTLTEPFVLTQPVTAESAIRRLAPDVELELDPTIGSRRVAGIGRSITGTTDSWRELGALATRLGARVIALGDRLRFGTDRWLCRSPARTVRENTDHVGRVRFHLDAALPTDRAHLDVDAGWDLDAGDAIALAGCGPADGAWLIAEWSRRLPHAGTTKVRLTRSKE